MPDERVLPKRMLMHSLTYFTGRLDGYDDRRLVRGFCHEANRTPNTRPFTGRHLGANAACRLSVVCGVQVGEPSMFQWEYRLLPGPLLVILAR